MTSTFRTRDVIAMILLLYLMSVAFDPVRYNDADLSASIQFSFVIPRKQQHRGKSVLISMLDVDGDDSSEALAMWRYNNRHGDDNDDIQEGSTEDWSLQILDLSRISLASMNKHHQPRHPSSFIKTLPFQPKVLFNSTVIGTVVNPHQKMRKYVTEESIAAHNIRFYPLAFTTGHIIFPDHHTDGQQMGKTTEQQEKVEKEEEPTNYYYCGTDWMDASQKCEQPCPSGSGCPDGQRCFAECKSCPSSSSSSSSNPNNTPNHGSEPVEYHTTVAGGWPSICTVWSQGQITMHTITAEKDKDRFTTTGNSNKKQPQSSSLSSTLQLRQLWNVSLVVPHDQDTDYRDNGTQPIIELANVAITFVDPISSAMIFTSSSSDSKRKDASNNDNHGIVLVTGTITAHYYPRVAWKPTNPDYDYYASLHNTDATFVMAFDAYTGQRIWHSTSSYEMEHILFYPESPGLPSLRLPNGEYTDPNATTTVPLILPRQGLASSVLRRRSGMVSPRQRQRIMQESTYQDYEALKQHGTTSHINCLHEYRRSIFTTMGTLPYQYDGTNDYGAKVLVTHFDHQGTTNGAVNHHHRSHPDNKLPRHRKTGKSKKAKNHFAKHVEYGRPNVVVVHNYQGINVHALRNGRSLCHISLSDRTAYDDIDHDGTVDSIQLSNFEESYFQNDMQEVNDVGFMDENRRYVVARGNQYLNGSMTGDAVIGGDDDSLDDNSKHRTNQARPCFALSVVSGLTSAEPTYFRPITCHKGDYSNIHHSPLLLIDNPIGLPTSNYHPHHHPDHARNYKDVIVALSNGMIGRMHGKFGVWIWKSEIRDPLAKRQHPSWNDSSVVTLQQLYVNHYQSPDSPILLAGQDSIAILSSTSGRVVTMVALPQFSTTQRPFLFDINGDGTSDIIVVTNDAVWGYTIFIRTSNGMSTSYRILVGFVMTGLMLAYLRNRFGPHPGKRSTDL